MRRGDQEVEGDGRDAVDAPVIAALNRIALHAVIGFSIVAGGAALPLIVRMDHLVHEAFHVGVPLAWLAYAAVIGALRILRPPPPEPDVWARAALTDPGLTRFVRVLSSLMIVGWLASVAVVIVNHHLSTPRDVLLTVAVMLPLIFATWLLAVLAWKSWCRSTLARAESDASQRLRRYWNELARSRQAGQ